jgi:2-polyprenyl-3-methyl-5-hydroxy-6-metoxy-1,4-benzoquinol methylase
MQRTLIAPITERLLDLKRGERVLEIACGNGAFARRMAALGARVVACDFAEMFVERAQARTVENADRIEYRVVDATDEAALLALGAQSFDAAVCTMGLMDMPEIDPLLRALSQLLKPRARVVFAVMVRRSKPARCIRVQVPSSQGLANQIDPESCVQASNRLGEALTGERTGRVLSREKRTLNFRAPTDS